jgi:hypothetical protein
MNPLRSMTSLDSSKAITRLIAFESDSLYKIRKTSFGEKAGSSLASEGMIDRGETRSYDESLVDSSQVVYLMLW